jgi:hypothetical protein
VAARYRDALAIFGIALGLRIVFSLLLANTFDRDEFVYLSLGRAVGNGAVPYRDFPFFHPPGILVLLGALNPLTTLWWPAARLADVAVDSGTAVLIWYVGEQLYDRRAALIAGLLYAVNPIVLVSAVRVDQEVVTTALGVAGLVLLVTRDSRRTAALAGACLAVACWVKYPALIFLPVYAIAAPRRLSATLVGFLTTGAALFLPYLAEAHSLLDYSVNWQLVHRLQTPLATRLEVAAIFWLGIGALAVVALVVRRNPLWLVAGFATGTVFVFTSSTYAHYFVLVAPYAALLAAPLVVHAGRLPLAVLAAACVALTALWAGLVLLPESRQFVQASTFSDARPVIRLIDRSSAPGTPVLSNRFQYAYLADRPPLALYFWDDHAAIGAAYLERRLSPGTIIVMQPHTDLVSFPPGLPAYLDRTYSRRRIGEVEIWIGSRVANMPSGRRQQAG